MSKDKDLFAYNSTEAQNVIVGDNANAFMSNEPQSDASTLTKSKSETYPSPYAETSIYDLTNY